jgi:osmotically-inducible protein OsmY
MKLISSKDNQQTAAEAGREAVKGAGRGALLGFGIGAVRGAAQGAAQTARSRVEERFRPTRRDQAKSKARAARDQARNSARSARDSLRGPAQSISETLSSSPSNRRKRGAAAAAGGAAAAAGVYFLDPQSGKRRRHVARDRITALGRKGKQQLARQARYRRGQAEGVAQSAKSQARPEQPAPNDQALTERVQSEIFRPADAPKGSVDVNVEAGVVYLRGEVDEPDQANDLIDRAESVDGVVRVESLLHQPGEPAPKKGSKRKATA